MAEPGKNVELRVSIVVSRKIRIATPLAGAVVNASVAAGAAIAFSKMADLTTARALVSDGNGDVSVSAVTSTEIGYLDGVTSAIQTQINNKPSNGFAVAMAIAL